MIETFPTKLKRSHFKEFIICSLIRGFHTPAREQIAGGLSFWSACTTCGCRDAGEIEESVSAKTMERYQ